MSGKLKTIGFVILVCSLIMIIYFTTNVIGMPQTEVNITLNPDNIETNYSNIIIILGEITECNPTPNQDWIIEDNQVCDNKEIDIGTGSIIINTNGTLTLINSSNVTAKSLQINTTGDVVYIYSGCELRLG